MMLMQAPSLCSFIRAQKVLRAFFGAREVVAGFRAPRSERHADYRGTSVYGLARARGVESDDSRPVYAFDVLSQLFLKADDRCRHYLGNLDRMRSADVENLYKQQAEVRRRGKRARPRVPSTTPL